MKYCVLKSGALCFCGLPPKLLMTMKLVMLILFTCLMQVSASTLAQKITLSEKNTSLEQVLRKVKSQIGYEILFASDVLDQAKNVTVNFSDVALKEGLDEIFENQPLTYELRDNTIIVRRKAPSFLDRLASAISNDDRNLADIRGVVRNEKGEPLEGITVMVKGAKTGTRTNAKGEFVLKGVKKGDVLVFTGVAIEPFEYTVKDDKSIDLNLKARLVQLEEVNVEYNTGYQKISKERAVGSFEYLDSANYHRRAGMGILERLDGTVTGVLFNKKGPVGVAPIQIRGISSLSFQNPLIVVDDFPMDSRFDINNINPNDIENVTILKDAAAASIWGARAGNGVIVITTKKGKYNQKNLITASSNLKIENKPDLFYYPRISVSDYIDIEKELFSKGLYNRNINNRFTWPVVSPVVELLSKVGKNGFSMADADKEIDKLRTVDVRDELNKYVYRHALQQQYSISFSGGSNTLNYQLSTGYNHNRTKIQGDQGNNQFTVHSSAAFRPLSRAEIQLGLNYTQGKNQSVPFTLPNTAAPYSRLLDDSGNALPIPFAIRTAYLDTLSSPGLMDWRYRPLDEISNSDNLSLNRMVDLTVNTSYNFTSWLKGNFTYAYRYQSNSDRNHSSVQSYSVRDLINRYFNATATTSELRYPIPVGGILSIGNSHSSSENFRFSLNIDKSWNNDHQFLAMLGFERSENKGFFSNNQFYGYNSSNNSYNRFMDYANYYPMMYATFPGSLGQIPNGNQYGEQVLNRAVSLLANSSYIYKNKYAFYASARKDGVNVFGVNTNNKWKPLWSVGGKWDLSKESFFKVDFIPTLSARGSFGYLGNVNGNGSGKLVIQYDSSLNPSTRLSYAYPITANNPELRWEEVRELNFGLDFGLFANRLAGSMDFFRKKSTDVIWNYPFDPTSGLSEYFVNSADLQGKGFEVKLTSKNISGNFSWNTSFGLSYAKNIITKLYRRVNSASSFVQSGGGITPAVGRIPYGLYSYRWAGLNRQTGDPQGYLNGEVSQDYNAIDNDSIDNQVFHGSSIPFYSGLLLNSFSWRGVSFSFNITGRFDYYFRKPALTLIPAASGNISRYTIDYYRRWQKPGDELTTNVPSVSYPVASNMTGKDVFYRQAEIQVLRGDNIRLQDIRIQYQWINKGSSFPFKIISTSLYTNNLNFILWRRNKSDFDPDFVGGDNLSSPSPKTWTLGLNLTF